MGSQGIAVWLNSASYDTYAECAFAETQNLLFGDGVTFFSIAT